jgi:hypothetical protein
MNLIILKTVITIGLILCLAWIAEKASPRIAGILSGYPIGSALVLFFYGIQVGPGFAVATVPYNLLGHVSALVFVYFYFLGSRDSTLGSTILASFYALGGYLAAAWIMSSLTPTLLSGAAISFSSIALFSFLFRKIPNTTIDHPTHYTPAMLLFRLVFSTAIVLIITGFAQSVGVRWAGLLSAFPLVVYPLLALIHLNYGARRAHTVLKNFPRGLWTVLAYSLTISWAYGRFGVYLGTLVGYSVATAVLLIVNWKIFFENRTNVVRLGKVWKVAKL